MIKLNCEVLQECYEKVLKIWILQTSDTTSAPELIENYQFSRAKFKGIRLKQDSVSFLHKNVVNLYIFYTN